MKYIKTRLPDIQVHLIAPGERLMDDALFKKLELDAERAGVGLS